MDPTSLLKLVAVAHGHIKLDIAADDANGGYRR